MKKLFACLSGLLSIEYALMASLLAIVTFASMQLLGDDPTNKLLKITTLG